MNSKQAYKEILSPRSSTFGSALGRYNTGTKPENTRVFDRVVNSSRDGYDVGGAYWGLAGELRVEYTADLSFIHFYWVQYTVYFKIWQNNHTSSDEPETYNQMITAFDRARKMNTVVTEQIEQNSFVVNGCETSVYWYKKGQTHRWNP